MCAGHHFANQEILFAVAVMVTQFDIKFFGWKNLNESKSDRPAEDDKRSAGFIPIFPDRKMEIRMRTPA
jgi:hypothetical protein